MIDPIAPHHYIDPITGIEMNMDSHNLKDINKKLDELISAYQACKDENRKLKADADTWQHERTRLLQQNELARNKIAEMIARLRHLEHESHD